MSASPHHGHTNGAGPAPEALEAVAAVRGQLWDEGFRPLPVFSHNHGDPDQAGKAPLGAGWPERARRDPPEAVTMPAVAHALNTGILCDGLRGVDVDVDDPELAGQIQALAFEMLGETIGRYRENSGRRLLPYRAAEGSPPKRRLRGKLGLIEILGHGCQFVSHGTHKSGAELYWSPEPPEEFGRDNLTAVTEEEITAFLRAVAPLIEADPAKAEDSARERDREPRSYDSADRDEVLDVIAALAAIPNNAPKDWVHWNNLGMAAWVATGGDEHAFAAWRAWSAQHPTHDEAACRKRWDTYPTCPPDRIGAGLLYKLAHEAIPGWRRPSETRAEARWRRQASGVNGQHSGEAPPDSGDSIRADANAWGDPVDFLVTDAHGAPVLKQHHVPEAIWRFATDTAERMGVDPTAVALCALVSCAAVCSDEWVVQPKRHDYTWVENPRLWGAIVGDPSIMKSPIIKASTAPIDKLEAEARREHSEKMREWRVAEAAAKADKTAPPPRPRCDRFMVEGVTVEALSEVLRDDEEARFRVPCRKVLSRHDEMGEFFGSLDRYKSGGKGGGDRGAYLRLYNGGRYTVDRVGRGSFAVDNWSACYLGGIQPEPIQRIAREADDDGLLQRFTYCVPDAQEAGADRRPDHQAIARYAALFPTLVAMQPAVDEDGHPHVVALHEAAHKHREEIDTLTRAMAAMPDTSARLKAALGKWPGLFARFCLVFHLVEIADQRAQGATAPRMYVIQESVAERVAAYIREIALPHLLRAEGVMFSTVQTSHARWIAGLILSQGLERVTVREVVRAYKPLKSPEAHGELMATMDNLVTVGWLEPERPSNPAKGVVSWRVNPRVHTKFAERAKAEAQRRREAKQRIAEAIAAVGATLGTR